METIILDTERRLHAENQKPRNDDKFYESEGIFTHCFSIEHWSVAKLKSEQYTKILHEVAEKLDVEILDIAGQTVYIANFKKQGE